VQLSEVQRSRVLSSTVRVVSEYGYGLMTVSRVAGGARVSRRTFYDLFSDREDCFLAAFEDGAARVSERVLSAYEGEGAWRERVRAGLEALLGFLDGEPDVASLLIVDALKAGPRVQEARTVLLDRLADGLQRDGSRAGSGQSPPALAGEGVVGGVLGVVHTRLSAGRPGRMLDLSGPLMGMIVLPYLGTSAARRELERTSKPARTQKAPKNANGASPVSSSSGDPLAGLPMRVTGRTLLVVKAIGEHPGASNREVADLAGISDQGQMSKLLARLEGLGLVANTGEGHTKGEPNAWRLTPRGNEIQRTITAPRSPAGPRTNTSREHHTVTTRKAQQ
jgi:AcrR family transcriptional regulator